MRVSRQLKTPAEWGEFIELNSMGASLRIKFYCKYGLRGIGSDIIRSDRMRASEFLDALADRLIDMSYTLKEDECKTKP